MINIHWNALTQSMWDQQWETHEIPFGRCFFSEIWHVTFRLVTLHRLRAGNLWVWSFPITQRGKRKEERNILLHVVLQSHLKRFNVANNSLTHNITVQYCHFVLFLFIFDISDGLIGEQLHTPDTFIQSNTHLIQDKYCINIRDLVILWVTATWKQEQSCNTWKIPNV